MVLKQQMNSALYKIGLCSVVFLSAGCATSHLSKSSMHRPSAGQNSTGVYHQVKPGQTLWRIAKTYNVDVQTLVRVNQLADSNALEVEQKLYIPGATQEREVSSRCPCGPDVSKALATPKAPPVQPRPQRVAPLPKEVFARSAPASPQPALAPQETSFLWPVYGEITRVFEQDAGRRHDGIDIAAPQGTPIVAAADGKVLFSGWGPGGYGLLVILRHEGDIVTIYAHNEQNLVEVDQDVRQGDMIAMVGRTGRATGNHLHFEIRHRTVPVSPYKFLPPKHQSIALLEKQ